MRISRVRILDIECDTLKKALDAEGQESELELPVTSLHLASDTNWDRYFSPCWLNCTTRRVNHKLLVNGAVFESFQKIIMPSYGEKVLKHEAGHFLIAYLLGCPVEGCVLSPIAALQDARFAGMVSAGTSFFDSELSQQVNGRKPLSRQSIDRFSMIVMAGIAAEAIHFGQADGGAGDEISLVRFLTKVTPRGGGASAWNMESIKNQARWGALQSVLLLREYKVCYEALVDALERGGNLGECVYAIEKAARDNNVEVMTEPKGIILDKDPYGEWVMDVDVLKQVEGVKKENEEKEISANVNGSAEKKEEENISTEEFLKKYKKAMEEKLKEIDDQLKSLSGARSALNRVNARMRK